MRFSFSLRRRHFSVALLNLGLSLGLSLGLVSQAAVASAPESQRILVLGDSLSAEYGLRRASGWVALLEKRLAAEKILATVFNASISGDTTSGGRARLAPLLAKHRPHVLVIELGANDALRGLPLDITRANLEAMTAAAQQTGARVLLLGIELPPNYGAEYNAQLQATFAQVSRNRRTSLVASMLKSVASAPNQAELFQADRIHPNEAAQPIILNTLWPALRPLLRP